MSTETIHRIEALHAIYCNYTGRCVPLDSRRQHEWFDLLDAIRDMDCPAERAVILVANRLKAMIKAKQKWESALDFGRFVGRVDEFQDNLAAALAEKRKPVRSAQLKAVEAFTGRPMEPKQAEPRKIDEVLESAARKAFLELRNTL